MAVLDHLVYATPDLDATVAALAAATGVTAAPGGRHEGLGTRNALVGLTGTGGYLEVIGPDPDYAGPNPVTAFGIDSLTQPRLVTWAARVDHLDDAVERARAAGYDPGETLAMTRRRPDGVELAWRLSLPTDEFDGIVPFLIDWGDTPHPSVGLPALHLSEWRAEHPAPYEVAAALVAVDAKLDLARGAEARVYAVVEGPAGRYRLD